ncbi:MAG: hypothetical protein LGB53_03490 [Sulfurovum sp.]|nr:hypothetical protein [Sulfurovum sp.]
MWKFKNIETYINPDEVSLKTNHVAYHGDYTLDDRGRFVESLFDQKGIKNKVYLKYDEIDFSFQDKEKKFKKNELTEKLLGKYKYPSIIIDATTLSFAEILYILSDTNKMETIQHVQILYVEPSEYKFLNSSVTTYDEFSLSDKLQQFPPLPGFTINTELEKVELVAFLGFEKQRLGQIFSTEEVIYENFIPIIPLPGFSAGWENRTINNHLKFFDPRYFFSEIKYVSANNPYQSLKLLEKIAETGKSFRVAPIGTKPNAIGCAVFLVNNEASGEDSNYGALYDFPVKSKQRSTGIGKIHIYNLIKEIRS